MKNITKALIVASLFTSVASAEQIGLAQSLETQITLSGKIEQECKVTSSTSGFSGLDLTSSSAQQSAFINTWCNIENNDTVSTTIKSANDGFLVSGNNKIAYTVSFDDASMTGTQLTTAQNLDLTVSGDAATITAGTQTSRTMSITPNVQGYEVAGTYTDTITISINAN